MTEQQLNEKIHEAGEEIVDTKMGDFKDEVKTVFHDILEELVENSGGAKQVWDADNKETDKDKRHKSFEDFLLHVKLQDTNQKAPSGMGELEPAEGGWLVETQFAQEIIASMHDTGILAPKCRKVTIGANANSLVMRAIDETDRATGSRWGGIRGYWVNEAEAITTSMPKFRRMRWELKKLGVAMYVTDELAQDTTALSNITTQAVGEEFGFMIDEEIINGTGNRGPLGILHCGCKVDQAEETGQTADTILAENILKMWNRMPANMRPGAEWYAIQDAEQEFMKMYIPMGASGIPVWLPPGNGLVESPNGRLMGRPINYLEQCKDVGDEGDVIFANFKYYLIIDKGGIDSASSMHVKFLENEMTYRWIYRIDGQPVFSTAVTPFEGTGNTRSPFVTLQDRA